MAGARYTPVNAAALEQFLAQKGFNRGVVGSEIVYTYTHNYSPAVKVKVWTSIRVGAKTVRAAGRDAIRVTAAYEWPHAMKPTYKREPSKNFGLYKAQRIFRTGGEDAIFERLIERMREAYAHCNEWIINHWRDLENIGATSDPKKPQS